MSTVRQTSNTDAIVYGKAIVSLVARLLLDDKHAVIMDYVAASRWVLLSKLASALKLQAKDAKQAVQHLLQQRLLREWRPAVKASKAVQEGRYPTKQKEPPTVIYIDYVHFCVVVQFRLMRMDKMMVRKDMAQRDLETGGGFGNDEEIYECPSCAHRSTNQQTGLSSLGMMGRFRCCNGDEQYCAYECALDHTVQIDSIQRVLGFLPTARSQRTVLRRQACDILTKQLYGKRSYFKDITVPLDEIEAGRMVRWPKGGGAVATYGVITSVSGSRATIRWEQEAASARGAEGGARAAALLSLPSASSGGASGGGATVAIAGAAGADSGAKTIAQWKKEVDVVGHAPTPWFTMLEIEAALDEAEFGHSGGGGGGGGSSSGSSSSAMVAMGAERPVELARLRAALRAHGAGAHSERRRRTHGGNASSLQERFMAVRNQILHVCAELRKLPDAEARAIMNDPNMQRNVAAFNAEFPQFSQERGGADGDGGEPQRAEFEVTTSIVGLGSRDGAERPLKRRKSSGEVKAEASAPTFAAPAAAASSSAAASSAANDDDDDDDDDGWEDG